MSLYEYNATVTCKHQHILMKNYFLYWWDSATVSMQAEVSIEVSIVLINVSANYLLSLAAVLKQPCAH